MKTRSLCAAFGLLAMVALVACGSSTGTTPPPEQWTLIFSDEFNTDGSPDPDTWNIELGYGENGWGNNEWQLYTDDPNNVKVENGNLVITALCDSPCAERDGSVTSARINTAAKFEQTYGRFEACIRLPQMDMDTEGEPDPATVRGLWPAFWMLGADFPETPWPRSGEIDIMEWVGRDPETAFGTIHGPDYSGAESFTRKTKIPEAGDCTEQDRDDADAFHLYRVEWDPGAMRFFVDDDLFVTRSTGEVNGRGPWVFYKDFFMILNIAVGGTLGGPVDESAFPAEMLIDYIRVYERAQ